GADGRYSKVRQLAGIDAGRSDVFHQDVMWFKLPAHGDVPRSVRVFRERGNSPVMAYATVLDSIQFGWTLPHGGYRDIASAGIGQIKARLKAAIPPYAELIEQEITSMRDLTLLDVFSACAPEWVRDGLVLIGDSAHTHSPIGAQGINVAIQDAVALHPVLVGALRANDTSATALRRFEVARRPDIDRIRKIQVMQSKAMLSSGRVVTAVRPVAAKVIVRSPVFRAVQNTLAFGNKAITIATELFTAAHGSERR
ncbi:MAG TPA: FAD-dependent monooxygenase, partial [Pseudonocardiaceae bacterium]|nr:FAD-dependent monooxygenase [Pseudonocardiaceae bacterium]